LLIVFTTTAAGGSWWRLYAADVGGCLACCLLNYVNKLGNIIQFIIKFINKYTSSNKTTTK
jgi:hypothetical protein